MSDFDKRVKETEAWINYSLGPSLNRRVTNKTVLAPGIEPGIFEVKAQYDNHYTTQEVHVYVGFKRSLVTHTHSGRRARTI